MSSSILIFMAATLSSSRSNFGYLIRETVLIFLWAYVLFVAGPLDGMFRWRFQVASAAILMVLVGSWLGWRLLRRPTLPQTGLEKVIGLFVVVQLGLVLLSHDPRRSLSIPAQTLAYALIFWCAFDCLRAGWPAELIEKTWLIVGGVLVGLGWLEVLRVWLAWWNVTVGLPYAPNFSFRLYAPLGDPNLMAACLNLVIPLALARAFVTPARLPRLLLFTLAAAGIGLHFFTSSRGGIAGLVAALCALAVAWVGLVSPAAYGQIKHWWNFWRQHPVVMGVLVILGFSGASLFIFALLSFRGEAMNQSVLDARGEYWGAAIRAWLTAPVWGVGLGTFPTVLLRVFPTRPFLHAHNVFLNALAEGGLINVGGLVLVLVSGARALWRCRGAETVTARARWAAIVAIWLGFLMHGLADDHSRSANVALPLVVMLAMALAEARPTIPQPRWHPLWLALPAMGLAIFSGVSLRAYYFSEQARASGAADWAVTARLFDQAIAADPGLAFYWQQAGYAYGRVAATGDRQARTKAIQYLEHALTLEPVYAVPRANLAALYWQAQRRAEARQAMQSAAEMAPTVALYQLNLGFYAEAEADETRARTFYQQALQLDPSYAASSFWQESPLRLTILAAWQADQPSIVINEQFEMALVAPDYAAAEQVLIRAWQANPQDRTIYFNWSRLARLRGELALAQRYIDCAWWVQASDLNNQYFLMLEQADLAHATGNLAHAEMLYRSVLAGLTDDSASGWGAGVGNWTPYDFFTFQREGLGAELLPQLVRADLPHAMAQRLLTLGELYEAQGQVDQAIDVYRTLLARDPLLTEAQARLAALAKP